MRSERTCFLSSVLSLGLLVGCAEERTQVALIIPSSILPELEELQVTVFHGSGTADGGAGDEVCFDLRDWGRSSCGMSCEEVPDFQPPTELVFFDETIPKNQETGAFDTIDVHIPSGTSWSLLIVGRDSEGSRVWGCARVDAAKDAMLSLWYPLCAAESCGSQYHAGCEAEINCLAIPNPASEAELMEPPCAIGVEVADGGVSYAWSQDGGLCPPPPQQGGYFGICAQATLVCEEGSLEPLLDGVCPGTGDEPCIPVGGDGGVYNPTEDYNCDYKHPVCDAVPCMPGTRELCGSDADCRGTTVCLDTGEWSDCQFGTTEVCDGEDQDCDELVDEAPAVDSCNVSRSAAAPIADQCVDGHCSCGGGLRCASNEACCGGTCVLMIGSDTNCGGCGIECTGTTVCVGSVCEEMDSLGDGGADVDCTTDESCGATANNCNRGTCECGSSPACTDPDEVCCSGSCVDVSADETNCGGCGRECDPGEICCQGICSNTCVM